MLRLSLFPIELVQEVFGNHVDTRKFWPVPEEILHQLNEKLRERREQEEAKARERMSQLPVSERYGIGDLMREAKERVKQNPSLVKSLVASREFVPAVTPEKEKEILESYAAKHKE